MRILLTSLLVVFCIKSAVSQEFNGGLLGGITASQIDNDKMAGYDKFGVSAGMFVCRKFTETASGQFELRYIQKGAADSKQNYSKRLDYMELGFLYKHHFKSFDAEAGVSPGFLINISDTYMDVENPNAKFADFDLPFDIGAYYFLGDKFALSARLSYSLILLGGYKNNVLSFTAYYFFK